MGARFVSSTGLGSGNLIERERESNSCQYQHWIKVGLPEGVLNRAFWNVKMGVLPFRKQLVSSQACDSERANCLKNGHILSLECPFSKPLINWTRSVFPLLILAIHSLHAASPLCSSRHKLEFSCSSWSS